VSEKEIEMTGRSRIPLSVAALAVTCLVVVAGGLTAPTTASAETKFETYPKLGFPRSPAYDNRGCESRTVDTGPGEYAWSVSTAYSFRQKQKQTKRGTIKLPKDTYSWQICWRPKGSKVQVHTSLGHYAGRSRERRLYAHIIDGNFGTGQYTVTSFLTRMGRMDR
jgi:hypothetical protein